MPYSLLTFLSSGSDWDTRAAGDGLCVIFYDSDTDFFAGGIGSSLGYTNYRGPMGYNASHMTSIGTGSAAHVNGVRDAYLGIGFDVKGAYATTLDGKMGSSLSGSTQYANTNYLAVSSDGLGYGETTLHPNSIGVRLGMRDYYKLHSKTYNLTDYPIASAAKYSSSPSVSLHQSVASRDDVEFTSARVTLQNNGQRVVVELKDNTTGNYYTYHVADLNNGGLGAGSNPAKLKAAISFATSDAFTNCDIKNVSIMGNIVDGSRSQQRLKPLSGTEFVVSYCEGVNINISDN